MSKNVKRNIVNEISEENIVSDLEEKEFQNKLRQLKDKLEQGFDPDDDPENDFGDNVKKYIED